MSLVEVKDLSVAFGKKCVVNGASFTLERGETLALVGESGSGKSVTALSLLQLLPSGGTNPTGSILLNEEQIIGADPATLHRARGEVAGIVFQEPMTSLNPLHRVGRQVAEAITLHRRIPAHSLRERVIDVLNQAGFADAEHRLEASRTSSPAGSDSVS
jgi:microcin C transport system ATP-binding protein